MICFTYGSTPDSVIKAQANKLTPDGFDMRLTSSDYAIFAQAWNQGIDSHLEAFTKSTVKQVVIRLTLTYILMKYISYAAG